MTLASHEKPIRLSAHASNYIERRGFTTAEVERAVRESTWILARSDRLEAAMDCQFDDEWNGRHYNTKRVRVIFVEEADEIVVITVYTYFF